MYWHKNEAIREIGTYFFHNQEIRKWKKPHIFNLRLWKTRNSFTDAIGASLQTLTISKIVHLALTLKKLSGSILKIESVFMQIICSMEGNLITQS